MNAGCIMAKKTVKKAATKTVKKSGKKVGKKAAKKSTGKSANKTMPTAVSVESYIAKVDPARRADCERLVEIIGSVVKDEPRMWGASIVGFGSYHYKYDSGREGDSMLAGFSARAAAITVYMMCGFEAEPEPELMAKLGKYKTGKSCLYIKSLTDIDEKVLKELVKRSVKEVKQRYPS